MTPACGPQAETPVGGGNHSPAQTAERLPSGQGWGAVPIDVPQVKGGQSPRPRSSHPGPRGSVDRGCHAGERLRCCTAGRGVGGSPDLRGWDSILGRRWARSWALMPASQEARIRPRGGAPRRACRRTWGCRQEEAPHFECTIPPPAPGQGLRPLSCSLSARCPARHPGSRGCCGPRGPARLCLAPRSTAPPGRPVGHPGRRAEARGPGSRRASCPLCWGPRTGRPRTWWCQCARRRGCGRSGPPSLCSGS